MTTYYPPKKNATFIFYTALVSTANRPDFRANPTLAAGDVKVSTDGGSFGNITTLPDVDPDAGIAVKVSLSATEMNGDNIVVYFIDATGAEWDDLFINIQTAANQLDDIKTDTAAILVDTNELQTDDYPTSIAAVKTDTAAILADTGTDGVVVAAASKTDYALSSAGVDAVLDEVTEGTTTLRKAINVMLAVLAGKSSGGGTSNIKFRDVADSKDRISATVDSGGNRSSVTIDGS